MRVTGKPKVGLYDGKKGKRYELVSNRVLKKRLKGGQRFIRCLSPDSGHSEYTGVGIILKAGVLCIKENYTRHWFERFHKGGLRTYGEAMSGGNDLICRYLWKEKESKYDGCCG